MQELKDFIKNTIEFSEHSWGILQNCMSEKEFKKNETLLKEGQVCNAVYFVGSGFCKAVFNMDGKEVNTAFYFENSFVTNVKSLTTSSKSEYSIVACEKTKTVQFDKTRLLAAYAESHEIASFGRKILELVTASQEEHSNSFKLQTPRQRFDNLVSNHPDILQRVSLTQLASYLGVSRETLSRFRAVK